MNTLYSYFFHDFHLCTKHFFWENIFLSEDYSVKKFFLSFKDPKKRELYHHFWNYIEFPLFFFAFSIFYFQPLEIFIFNFTFYTFILYNIFVLGKIFRWNLKTKGSLFMIMCILYAAIWTVFWLFYIDARLIYIALLFPLVWMPVYFIVFLSVKKLIRSYK